MANTTLAERLNLALQQSGKNKRELALFCGVSTASTTYWFNGKTKVLTADNAMKAASFLGVSVEWLTTGKGEIIDKKSLSCDEVKSNGIISVPLLEVKASAGNGIENYSERVVRKIEFFENWLRQNVSFSSPTELEMITASGDSMEPTIDSDDILLVDRSVKEVLYDSIYVALVNGELYVKRFQRTPSRTLLMISDNTKYKAFELKPEDNIQILGRVVYHWTGGTL